MLSPTNSQVLTNSQISSSVPIDKRPLTEQVPPAPSVQETADRFDAYKQPGASVSSTQPDISPQSTTLSGPATVANFYTIYAALQQVLVDSHSQSLQEKLAINNLLITTRATNLAEALEAINIAKNNILKGTDDLVEKNKQLEDAQAALPELADRALALQKQLDVDRETLGIIKADLDKNPNDPVRQKKYEEALAAVDVSSQKSAAAQAELSSAQQTYDLAVVAVDEAKNYALAAEEALIQCTNDYLVLTTEQSTPTVSNGAVKTAMQVLMECMIKLNEIMSKYNDDKLAESNRLFQTKQDQLQKELVALADEFKHQLEEAERMQKKMKLAAKIFGGVVTALAGIAAVATGGVLSGLLALSTGLLMGADEILEHKGMDTISSKTMDPAMAKIMEGFTAFVKKIDPEIDDGTAQIVGMVLAVLAMAVASAAATKIAGKAASTELGAKISSMMPTFKGLASGSLPRLGMLLEAGSTLTALSEVTTQTYMGITTAQIQRDGKDSIAQTELNNADQDMLKKIVKDLVDAYCANNGSFELMQFLYKYISQKTNTMTEINNRISGSRAA